MQLGQEFFRWEMATAVAGSIIGINPFDQPDVEAAKVETRELTDAYEKSGALAAEKPVSSNGDGITLFADERNAAGAAAGRRQCHAGRAGCSAHFARLHAGDYFAAARLYRAQRRAYRRAAAASHGGARPQARRHLPRLRPALSALDRPGL